MGIHYEIFNSKKDQSSVHPPMQIRQDDWNKKQREDSRTFYNGDGQKFWDRSNYGTTQNGGSTDTTSKLKPILVCSVHIVEKLEQGGNLND